MDLQPLTILIGSNASGKSNALDGLRILSDSATGLDLAFVLDGHRSKLSTGVRGGSKACPRHGGDTFTLGAVIGPVDEDKRGGTRMYLDYELSIAVRDRIYVESESLHEMVPTRHGELRRKRMLFQTVPSRQTSGDISVEYNNLKRGANPQFTCLKFQSVLSQMESRLPKRTAAEKHILNMSHVVARQLQKVLFLDPIPHDMRDYVPRTSVELVPSASNLSAVLAKIVQDEPAIKEVILRYLRQLPDQEILDLDFVDTPLGDVMLTVLEKSGEQTYWIDARGLSDGTLRTLAVMAALLSEEEDSLVVIEEVDNGLHPSKARTILSLLMELSSQRNIHLLVTTHNPALLNAIQGREAAGVVVCYRHPEKGDSRFVSLVDLDEYLRIASHERIGDAMESGQIARAVRGQVPQTHRDALEWLKSL